jgi:hypothetical protein
MKFAFFFLLISLYCNQVYLVSVLILLVKGFVLPEMHLLPFPLELQ